MFVFSHQARLTILQLLKHKPLSQAQLKNNLSLSDSEVSRHIAKLRDAHFIMKIDRDYKITQYGVSALSLFAPLQFYFEYSEYFTAHSIALLPSQLQRGLDALTIAEFIDGQGFVMIRFSEMIATAQQEILLMTDQPFPFGKEKIKVQYILTPDLLQFNTNPAIELKLTEAVFRFIENMPVAMCIVDKTVASIHFPDLTGKIDFSYGFFSDNKDVINYLLQIWTYFFKNSKTMQEIRS